MREYSDKIFDSLKKIMKQYSPPFSIAKPSGALVKKRNYELVSNKKVNISGRERNEVYFAGIIKQKDYVGFYYMLAYMNPKVTDKLDQNFIKLLKGKTCIYIRGRDDYTLTQVKLVLDIALKIYK